MFDCNICLSGQEQEGGVRGVGYEYLCKFFSKQSARCQSLEPWGGCLFYLMTQETTAQHTHFSLS